MLSRAENYDNAQRFFFYLNGRGIGDFGNDQLASEIDYAQQLAVSRNNTGAAPGQFTPIVGWNANFDASYQPYNPANVSQSGSSYTVSSGETLQSIALNIWGDASLWYVLAEANGLSAGTALAAGRMLSVPGKVYNLHNGSDTFQPYNPLDALGNTHPTRPKQPQPPAPTTVANKKGCGGIGQILTAIVAVVVVAIVAPYAINAVSGVMSAGGAATGTAAAIGAGAAGAGAAAGAAAGVTAGLAGSMAVAAGGLAAGAAAGASLTATVIGSAIAGAVGSIASQGFAIAIGNQDRLNWGAVAIAGIAGGVGGAFGKLLPGSKIATVAGRSAATNAVSQGINIAVGLQKTFDWTGMAVAGVTGGAGARAGSWAAGRYGETGAMAITGTASLLAGAATRSLLTGQDFSRSVRDALPDAIGSTVGGIIEDALTESRGGSNIGSQLERLKSLEERLETRAAFTVRTRPDEGEITSLSLGALPDREITDYTGEVPRAYVRYTVAAGDMLTSIYKKFNPEAGGAEVVAGSQGYMIDNNILNPSRLQVGTDLILRGADAERSPENWAAARHNYAVDDAIVQQRLAAREAAKDPFNISGWMSNLTATNQWVCSPWSLEGSALLGTGTARSQPFVIESYQAALNDATKRFSTVSMEEAAFVQGFTFNYADEIDASFAYLETGANNFLARFGITEGASYSAGQAYNAVMEVDNNTLAAWQESKPVTYGLINLAGGIANPVNRAGGGWAWRASSLSGLTLRGAAFGGATGAVYGFGSGTDWQSRFDNAAVGGSLGLTLGAGAPLAGKYVVAPVVQKAQPYVDTLASIRFSVEPGTLGSNFGNLRITFRNTIKANKIAGDSIRDIIAAREAPALTEQVFTTVGGVRRVDVLKLGTDLPFAIESKVGRTSLGRVERRELARDWWLLRQNRVSGVRWEFSPSSVNGGTGPTPRLQQMLNKLGFETRINP